MANPGTPPGTPGRPARGKGVALMGTRPLNPTPSRPPPTAPIEQQPINAAWANLVIGGPSAGAPTTSGFAVPVPATPPEQRRASMVNDSPPAAGPARYGMERRSSVASIDRASGVYSPPVSTSLLDALPSPSFDPPPAPPISLVSSSERLGLKVTKLPPPPSLPPTSAPLPPPPSIPPPPSPGRDSGGASSIASPAAGSPLSAQMTNNYVTTGPSIGSPPKQTPPALSSSPTPHQAPLIPPFPTSMSTTPPPLSLSMSQPLLVPPASPRALSDRSTSGGDTHSTLTASIKRNKKVVLQNTADHRKFRAHAYGGEYLGPKVVPPPPLQALPEATPLYVDTSGAVYDRNYSPLSTPLTVAERLLQNLPVPTDFTNFFAYEEALLNWKTKVEEALRSVVLPLPMGQYYNRPRLPSSNATSEALKTMEMPASVESPTPEGPPPAESDFTEHQLTADPWHALLVPPEPNPDSFNSYEEYEAALLRWGALCSETLPVIPPHASQLPSLLPMRATVDEKKPNREKRDGTEPDKDTKLSRSSTGSRKSTALPSVSFLPAFDIPRLRWESDVAEIRPAEVVPVRKDTLTVLHKMFGAALARVNATRDRIGTPNLPALPLLHGTFPLASRPPSSSLTLRRPGLTDIEQRLSLDCAAEIEGKRVEFRMPEHDVENIVWRDFFLKNAEDYKASLRNELLEQEQRHRLDQFYSWYHPKTGSATLQQHRNELLTFFMGASNNWSDFFCRNQSYLDKFQDFIVSRPYADDDESPNVISVLTKRLDHQQFCNILDLIPNSNSPLIHAKISAFLFEAFQDLKMKTFLEVLVTTPDLPHLSILAYALCLTLTRPLDIFPYNDSDMTLLKKVFPDAPSVASLVKSIYVLYYLQCAEKPLAQGVFLGINSFVQEQRRNVVNVIDGLLTKSSTLFSQLLLKGVGNRSSSVSHLCAFACLQLINNHDPVIQKFLRPPQTKLPQLLRQLGASKFSHVQNLTRVFFQRIQTEFWVNVLYGSLSVETIKEDLMRPASGATPHTLTQLLLDFTLPLLRSHTPQSMSLLSSVFVDERLVTELLVELNDSEKNGYKNSHDALAEFLHELIAMWTRGGAVAVSADKASKRLGSSASRSNLFTLVVTVADYRNLMTLAESRKLRENEHPGIYKNKTYALRLLQKFFELPEVFSFTRSLIGDQALFAKMLAGCRDANVDYNRAAYQLFFKMIRVHANVVEALAKGNALQPFLEVAGPSFPNGVICNSLHYLAKLFSLETLEQKRIAQGKPPKRHGEQANLKTIKDDLKALTKFYLTKRLFIKVHIIYMRLNTNPFSYPGLLFHELANLFWVICNTPACKKLFRDLQGHSEYREKLSKIIQMYSPPVQQREMSKIMSRTGLNG